MRCPIIFISYFRKSFPFSHITARHGDFLTLALLSLLLVYWPLPSSAPAAVGKLLSTWTVVLGLLAMFTLLRPFPVAEGWKAVVKAQSLILAATAALLNCLIAVRGLDEAPGGDSSIYAKGAALDPGVTAIAFIVFLQSIILFVTLIVTFWRSLLAGAAWEQRRRSLQGTATPIKGASQHAAAAAAYRQWRSTALPGGGTPSRVGALHHQQLQLPRVPQLPVSGVVSDEAAVGENGTQRPLPPRLPSPLRAREGEAVVLPPSSPSRLRLLLGGDDEHGTHMRGGSSSLAAKLQRQHSGSKLVLPPQLMRAGTMNGSFSLNAPMPSHPGGAAITSTAGMRRGAIMAGGSSGGSGRAAHFTSAASTRRVIGGNSGGGGGGPVQAGGLRRSIATRRDGPMAAAAAAANAAFYASQAAEGGGGGGGWAREEVCAPGSPAYFQLPATPALTHPIFNGDDGDAAVEDASKVNGGGVGGGGGDSRGTHGYDGGDGARASFASFSTPTHPQTRQPQHHRQQTGTAAARGSPSFHAAAAAEASASPPRRSSLSLGSPLVLLARSPLSPRLVVSSVADRNGGGGAGQSTRRSAHSVAGSDSGGGTPTHAAAAAMTTATGGFAAAAADVSGGSSSGEGINDPWGSRRSVRSTGSVGAGSANGGGGRGGGDRPSVRSVSSLHSSRSGNGGGGGGMLVPASPLVGRPASLGSHSASPQLTRHSTQTNIHSDWPYQQQQPQQQQRLPRRGASLGGSNRSGGSAGAASSSSRGDGGSSSRGVPSDRSLW